MSDRPEKQPPIESGGRMSATERPWLILRDPRPGMEWNNHIGILRQGTEYDVCFMTHDGTTENEEGEANAKLIVSAVNAHDTALALARAVLDALTENSDEFGEQLWIEDHEKIIELARKFLDQAGVR